MEFSINALAERIVREEIIPNQDALNVKAHVLNNGAMVLDMGIYEKGGFRAGVYFTETCMGGLGEMTYRTMRINGHLVPLVAIHVDRPAIAELASHDAFLYIDYRGRRLSVSGPIRAITGTDKFARSVAYRDPMAKTAVCHIQIDEMPTEEMTELIAESIGFSPNDIILLAAKTGTLTGAAQVCARNVEQSLPSLLDHGFDVNKVVQACGYAPIVSVVDDENIAYGRVNDGLLYGQETNLYVRCEDSEIERVLEILPFSKNADVFGTSFEELFAQCSYQWSRVPRHWDAPCKVNFFNLKTSRHFSTGSLHMGVLERSFLG